MYFRSERNGRSAGAQRVASIRERQRECRNERGGRLRSSRSVTRGPIGQGDVDSHGRSVSGDPKSTPGGRGGRFPQSNVGGGGSRRTSEQFGACG